MDKQKQQEAYKNYVKQKTPVHNLDEFFMVRVGSIHEMSLIHDNHRDIRSDLTPEEQLDEIAIWQSPYKRSALNHLSAIIPIIPGITNEAIPIVAKMAPICPPSKWSSLPI